MNLTAAQGIAAAQRLKRAGVLGIDSFEAMCRLTGIPEKAALPVSALDALVAANVDAYRTEQMLVSILRYLGINLYSSDASAAIAARELRDVYRRVRARTKVAPVRTVVRATLVSLIRHGVRLNSASALTFVYPEILKTPTGLVIQPGPMRAIRALVGVSVAAASSPIIFRVVIPWLFPAFALRLPPDVPSTVYQWLVFSILAATVGVAAELSRALSSRIDDKYARDWWVRVIASLVVLGLAMS